MGKRRRERQKRARGDWRDKGITPHQASYLATLQRWAGERYTGNGMSRGQAHDQIERLLHKLGRRPKAPPDNSELATGGAA